MLEVDPTLASRTVVIIKKVQIASLSAINVSRKETKVMSPIDLLWAANESAMDKMGLILLTRFDGRVVNPLPMNTLLHAACSADCHCRWDLFSRILQLNEYSSQASTRDTKGNLPLHYAVRNSFLIDKNSIMRIQSFKS
jgi:hypothetical protein